MPVLSNDPSAIVCARRMMRLRFQSCHPAFRRPRQRSLLFLLVHQSPRCPPRSCSSSPSSPSFSWERQSCGAVAAGPRPPPRPLRPPAAVSSSSVPPCRRHAWSRCSRRAPTSPRCSPTPPPSSTARSLSTALPPLPEPSGAPPSLPFGKAVPQAPAAHAADGMPPPPASLALRRIAFAFRAAGIPLLAPDRPPLISPKPRSRPPRPSARPNAHTALFQLPPSEPRSASSPPHRPLLHAPPDNLISSP